MTSGSKGTSRLKLTALISLGLCILLFLGSWALGFQEQPVNTTFYVFMALGLALLWADWARAKTPATGASAPKKQKAAKAKAQQTTAQPAQPAARREQQRVSSGALLNGHYAVEKELRVGGMSIITLARDTNTGARVVIKTPRYDTHHDCKINVEKLEIEAEHLSRFSHPNIIKFVEKFTHSGVLHLVVEYIDGEDLFTGFARVRAEERRVIRWADQILSALEYIHSNAVVHRDINPGNIMLRRDDSVVIIDFGTIKPPAITSGTEVRKYGFEVPEQVLWRYADERSDLFGVGGTLYYLLTCTPPGSIGNQKVDRLLTDNYGVSQRTARCVAQALQVEANTRFQSAVAMRRALCSGES